MASNDNFKTLQLKGVIELDREELSRGAYGKVYPVTLPVCIWAAKEILVKGFDQVYMQ